MVTAATAVGSSTRSSPRIRKLTVWVPGGSEPEEAGVLRGSRCREEQPNRSAPVTGRRRRCCVPRKSYGAKGTEDEHEECTRDHSVVLCALLSTCCVTVALSGLTTLVPKTRFHV